MGEESYDRPPAQRSYALRAGRGRARGPVTSLRRQGRKEERKGEAKEELADHQDKTAEKAQEVADLERKT